MGGGWQLHKAIRSNHSSMNIDEFDVPTLDIGNHIGGTGYIDFIQWKKVPYSVMKGRDRYKRAFLVVKCVHHGTCHMQTFFQRYTNGSEWQSGECYGRMDNNGYTGMCMSFLETSGGMSKHQCEFLTRLIQDGRAQVQDPYDLRCRFHDISQDITVSLAKEPMRAWDRLVFLYNTAHACRRAFPLFHWNLCVKIAEYAFEPNCVVKY